MGGVFLLLVWKGLEKGGRAKMCCAFVVTVLVCWSLR